jgi:membrane fusion protein (multidrug efflux system)
MITEVQKSVPVEEPETKSAPVHTRSVNWARIVKFAATLAIIAAGAVYVWQWVQYRRAHSITDDAFVESHIVNVAPQQVTGRIIRLLVEENDRVTAGQVIAEIDPTTYRDQVRLVESKLALAKADLSVQEATLHRLKEQIPLQIQIAKKAFDAAQNYLARAEKSLALVIDNVNSGIDAAKQQVESANADLKFAKQEIDRYQELVKKDAAPVRVGQSAERAYTDAQAAVRLAEIRLSQANFDRARIEVSQRDVDEARVNLSKAERGVALAETGQEQIIEAEHVCALKREAIETSSRELDAARNLLNYTQIHAPIAGIVVKRFRNLGDAITANTPIIGIYDTNLLYVTANLEESRLDGVAPGNNVELRVDAFENPFRGRVVWINKATGANFALMPRNVVSGEFTKVVQRVPVRIQIEKDPRWPSLRAGLSVQVDIEHGNGDPVWAENAAREMASHERTDPTPPDEGTRDDKK